MKNIYKVLGIIVMMMIGMLMLSCEDLPGGEDYNLPPPIESPNVGTLMPIPAGIFTMGSLEAGANPDFDETEHRVTLSAFFIGKYEVTQEQYEEVMEINPSYFQGESELPADGETQGKRPVEQVSWYDAIVFCNTLSIKEGLIPVYSIGGKTNPEEWGNIPEIPEYNNQKWDAAVCNWTANGYRLPTEAEWEYACRAGTTTAYNTGNTISDNTGWYRGNSDSRTHEVGKKPANAWGLFDMHGNVWEWCGDWYEQHYPRAPQTDPKGPLSGEHRVFRGGSWVDFAQYQHSANRYYDFPPFQNNDIGIRVLRSHV